MILLWKQEAQNMNNRIISNVHFDSNIHTQAYHQYSVSDVTEQNVHPGLGSLDLLQDIPDNGILQTFSADPFPSGVSTVNELLRKLESNIMPIPAEVNLDKEREKNTFIEDQLSSETKYDDHYDINDALSNTVNSSSDSSESSNFWASDSKQRNSRKMAYHISGKPLVEFTHMSDIISGAFP